MDGFFRSEAWAWIWCGIKFLMIVLIIAGIVWVLTDIGLADGEQSIWVLCDPDSYVCIREAPKKAPSPSAGQPAGRDWRRTGRRREATFTW